MAAAFCVAGEDVAGDDLRLSVAAPTFDMMVVSLDDSAAVARLELSEKALDIAPEKAEAKPEVVKPEGGKAESVGVAASFSSPSSIICWKSPFMAPSRCLFFLFKKKKAQKNKIKGELGGVWTTKWPSGGRTRQKKKKRKLDMCVFFFFFFLPAALHRHTKTLRRLSRAE